MTAAAVERRARVAVDQDRRLACPSSARNQAASRHAACWSNEIGLRLYDVVHVELEMTVTEVAVGVSGRKSALMALTRWRAPACFTISETCQDADVNARRLADYHAQRSEVAHRTWVPLRHASARSAEKGTNGDNPPLRGGLRTYFWSVCATNSDPRSVRRVCEALGLKWSDLPGDRRAAPRPR